ncbi:hypothetical protein [Candidatus Venteria ishoeyi]|uniref:Uncharacterized protein n=1 Tax=Candidatus Venteria ishoeyi TaxID=1899563 RepID=A0A1H6F5D6_9GAMM|nr:hypothetical protein [Candidatus Venteria ishoeyi]MDM8546180.1 hypothetical protein [Candidatus Venteria ishoeyi]SEH04773.1 Uncharacterised protein [Candidatus Venteria ishoeyi]
MNITISQIRTNLINQAVLTSLPPTNQKGNSLFTAMKRRQVLKLIALTGCSIGTLSPLSGQAFWPILLRLAARSALRTSIRSSVKSSARRRIGGGLVSKYKKHSSKNARVNNNSKVKPKALRNIGESLDIVVDALDIIELTPEMANTWQQSIAVAPSSPRKTYPIEEYGDIQAAVSGAAPSNTSPDIEVYDDIQDALDIKISTLVRRADAEAVWVHRDYDNKMTLYLSNTSNQEVQTKDIYLALMDKPSGELEHRQWIGAHTLMPNSNTEITVQLKNLPTMGIKILQSAENGQESYFSGNILVV